jgi:hypothetical protein
MLARRFLSSSGKWQSPESVAKIMVADLHQSKELVYTGPVNSLIRRLQLALTTTAVGSVVAGPLLLHYLTQGWSLGSQTFFCLSGTKIFIKWPLN